ncbi:MAG TPA: hypothetical protein VJP89_11390 [Pyrinomonadaceae bacterium]|nr:hypothetical protein [Pyrinomonadaceae bacterium]
MKRSKFAFLLAAVMISGAINAAQAQEHESRPSQRAKTSSVTLGNQVVLIPNPEGFEEATSQFEQVKQRFSLTEAPENDMLFVHLPSSDCELLRNGSSPTYDLYTKVSVLRASRTLTVSSSMMAAAVTELRTQAATYLDPNGPKMEEMERLVERGLSQVNSQQTKIEFDKPQILGVVDNQPNVFSLLTLLTIKANVEGTDITVPMLTTVNYVRVKERLIFVYTFRRFQSKADVEPLKAFTKKWTNSILAAN